MDSKNEFVQRVVEIGLLSTEEIDDVLYLILGIFVMCAEPSKKNKVFKNTSR